MLRFEKLEECQVTKEIFEQIMFVENSTGTGYNEEVMKEIFITGSLRYSKKNFIW